MSGTRRGGQQGEFISGCVQFKLPVWHSWRCPADFQLWGSELQGKGWV